MTAASRSLATALWGARFASGLLLNCYTTGCDTIISSDHLAPRRVGVGAAIHSSRGAATREVARGEGFRCP